MSQKILKYICFLGLLFLLLIPFIKQHTPILENSLNVEELKGYFPPVDSAHFSIKNWMDGSYQKKQEDFLKRDLKIRPYAVRVNNQLHYNLLDEIRRDIIEGKDNYLFEAGYIHAMLGKDFLGTKKIKEQADKLKTVSEYLKKENDVDLIVAIAFDKARFFEEKLPKQINLEKRDSTNYETYLPFLEKNKIHVLDFNKYLLEQKDKSEHALGTKHGIHWSLYGGLLATDSIMGYIEKLKGKEVNRIDKSEITKTTQSRKEDDDIGKSINLFYPLKSDTFSYFEHHLFIDNLKTYRPNITLIGDSFCWTIWGQDIPHKYWGSDTKFLYYYNEIYDLNWTPFDPLKKEQKLPFAINQDVIILLYTPMNLKNLGSDFIDDMYEIIQENDN